MKLHRGKALVVLAATALAGIGVWMLLGGSVPSYEEYPLYHYVRSDGRIENPPHDFPEGGEPLFEVRQGGKSGFMNVRGEVVIPPRFEHASAFSEGLAAVGIGGKSGYIDRTGRVVIEPRFASCRAFHEGLAVVCLEYDLPWGFVNTLGNMVIEPRFDVADYFHEGVGRVGFGTTASKLVARFADVGIICRYSYIDRAGNYVERPSGFRQGHPGEQLRPADRGDKAGYQDEAGLMVIPPRFEYAEIFSEGLAAVRLGGKIGFIDESGAMVIEPRFAGASRFKKGLCAVVMPSPDGRMSLSGYIDRTGRYVWLPSE